MVMMRSKIFKCSWSHKWLSTILWWSHLIISGNSIFFSWLLAFPSNATTTYKKHRFTFVSLVCCLLQQHLTDVSTLLNSNFDLKRAVDIPISYSSTLQQFRWKKITITKYLKWSLEIELDQFNSNERYLQWHIALWYWGSSRGGWNKESNGLFLKRAIKNFVR